MTIEVKEFRSAERYLSETPLSGSFGAAEVTVVDIGFGGAQILHPLPVRIGSSSRLWFRIGDVHIATTGRITWSHLWKNPETGKTIYRSGLRVEDPEFAAGVRSLVNRGMIRADSDSLERKKKRLIEQERRRSDKHVLKALPSESLVDSEQLLLIQHARERLRANPNEAARLYQLAHTADAANGVREDAVAVWEYLERSIALPTITRVFEGKG